MNSSNLKMQNLMETQNATTRKSIQICTTSIPSENPPACNWFGTTNLSRMDRITWLQWVSERFQASNATHMRCTDGQMRTWLILFYRFNGVSTETIGIHWAGFTFTNLPESRPIP